MSYRVTYNTGNKIIVPEHESPLKNLTWDSQNHVHAGESRFMINPDDSITLLNQRKINHGTSVTATRFDPGDVSVRLRLSPDGNWSIVSLRSSTSIIGGSSGQWLDDDDDKAPSSYSARWFSTGGIVPSGPAAQGATFPMGVNRDWVFTSVTGSESGSIRIEITWSNDPIWPDFSSPNNRKDGNFTILLESSSN